MEEVRGLATCSCRDSIGRVPRPFCTIYPAMFARASALSLLSAGANFGLIKLSISSGSYVCTQDFPECTAVRENQNFTLVVWGFPMRELQG